MPRHRNRGVRKRCGCSRKTWAKCPHGWYLNFKLKGAHYRLSLDREVGRRIEDRTEAETEADRLRTEIRNHTFRAKVVHQQCEIVTFSAFEKTWRERRGVHLVRPRDNEYRLKKIKAFVASKPELTSLAQDIQHCNCPPDDPYCIYI